MNAREPLTWADFIRLTAPSTRPVPAPRPAERLPLPHRTHRPPTTQGKDDNVARTEPHTTRRKRPPTRAQQEHADELFDNLSSALRDLKEPGADPTTALRAADRALNILHGHLRKGGVLPTPWHNARHP